MQIIYSDQENKFKTPEEGILTLCSQWGGVTSQELKEALDYLDSKACSKAFKHLVKNKSIRKVWYVTNEEFCWIVT